MTTEQSNTLAAWKRTRHKFLGASLMFFMCFIGSFFHLPKEEDQLTVKTFTLSKKPGIDRGKNRWTYKLTFEEDHRVFKLNGMDHRYLDPLIKNNLRDSLNTSDQVTVGYQGRYIYKLSFEGRELTDFKKAQYHKRQSNKITLIFGATGILLCLLPQLFKNQAPKISWAGFQGSVDFMGLLIVILSLVLILLNVTIGLEYIV